MTIYEDADGHILKRGERKVRPGHSPTTWCTRCQARVSIHKLSKDEYAFRGKNARREKRPRKVTRKVVSR